jgi:hypothetical protein
MLDGIRSTLRLSTPSIKKHPMVKNLLLPIVAIAAMGAAAVPVAYAMSGANGVMLNGLNDLALNGSDPMGETVFRAVRLTLPDGTALNFR